MQTITVMPDQEDEVNYVGHTSYAMCHLLIRHSHVGQYRTISPLARNGCALWNEEGNQISPLLCSLPVTFLILRITINLYFPHHNRVRLDGSALWIVTMMMRSRPLYYSSVIANTSFNQSHAENFRFNIPS